jgi:8-oxo-dGTP pyrophosphatase MutT (NUDIX family)
MQGDWRPATLTDVIDRPILAAGAVVWRPVGDRLEVLVIHRSRHDDWSLPKGKLARASTWRRLRCGRCWRRPA